MRIHILFASLLLLGLTAGCEKKNDNGVVPVIDVVGNLGSYRELKMSELISEVEYIPLETGQEFMIGGYYYDVMATSGHIIVRSGDYCHVFTRKGKFVTSIGRLGRGPGEHTGSDGISIDENNEIIYLDADNNILEYSLDGTFRRTINKPELTYNDLRGAHNRPANISFLRDNLFLGHANNSSGQEPFSWIIMDNTGSIVKTFPQPIRLEINRMLMSIMEARKPFVTSGEAWAHEALNDTLYLLNLQNELVPKYIFNLGKYAYPHDVYISPETSPHLSDNSILVNIGRMTPLLVTPYYIFFSASIGRNLHSVFNVPAGLSHTAYFRDSPYSIDDTGTILGLYDIADGKTQLLDRDPVTRKYGLINDLDGGLSFWPRYCTSNNELIDVLEAYEMKDLLTEEYFAVHPSRDAAAHARLRELVNNLDETDNPVIVIAKLKQ